MEKHITKKQNHRSFILLGFASIVILFLLYSRIQDPSVTPELIDSLDRLAIGFYLLLLISFGSIGYGLYRYHFHKAIERSSRLLPIIARATWNNRSKKIFVVTFITYGLFFSLTSGLIVYQPDVIFSHHYDAEVPSAHINTCCRDPGYMPEIIVYITEHVGLQIIPINLVFVIVVAYLVGLNTSLAINAFSITKKSGGLSGIGATTGLFIACPTCASTFFAIFVGSSGIVTFTVLLTQLQTLFIGITIPILLITPLIIAKKIKTQNDKCV
jgi:hypothetical protein